MDIAIWIVQGLLAFAFLGAGFTKLTVNKESAIKKLGPWTEDVSSSQIKLIGVLELLGGLGLVLPMAFNIYPILTPIAASGLTLTMLGAVGLHIRRKEAFIPPLVLGLLTAFVAAGRFFIIPVI